MRKRNNPASNEEQLETTPTDYRALLVMTRPLVVTEHTLPFWRGGQICRLGFGIPREPVDWRAESTLTKGEILRPGRSQFGITEDGELARGSEEGGASSAAESEDAAAKPRADSPETDSNLQIRIYLGMS
jgi:hypothetical protein